MAYIYQITNDVNGKIYVGKTEFSINKQFKEHCRDSQKYTEEHRPLDAAMRKYGVEHFHIELLEETDNPEERERYWIEVKGSFKNGYNPTMGGDKAKYVDYELIFRLFNQGRNLKDIRVITGYDCRTIQVALESISHQERLKRGHEGMFKAVAKLDKQTGEILEVFSSVREAEKRCGTNRHISAVCNGKRKTAGGYRWKYI